MSFKRKLCFILTLVLAFSFLPNVFIGTRKVHAESDLVLHLKFDDDLTDSSGNSNDGECSYGKITYEEGIFGKAAVFNGKSYIDVKDSDSLDLGDSFTISLWAYKGDMKKDEYVPYLYKEMDEDSGDMNPYYLYEHFSNTPGIYLHEDFGEEMDQYYLDGNPIDIHEWFLLTVTYDGDEVRIYKNDQLMKRESMTGTPVATIGDLYIGIMDGSVYFKGLMDDLKIYSRAISAQEVANRYNDGLDSNPDFLVQKDGLVAHYKFEDDFNDSSEFKNHGEKVTAEGTIKFVDGIRGKAAKFSKGSYIEVEANDTLDFDKGFTLTGWICIDAEETGMTLLNRLGVSVSDYSNEYSYRLHVRDEELVFYYYPFGDQPGSEYSGYSFDKSVKNKWLHIGLTFSGEEIRWYINGKLAEKMDIDESVLSHATGSLMIGSDGDEFFTGTLDDLKLYNYALSAKEIAKDAVKDSLYVSDSNQKNIKVLKVKGSETLTTYRKYIDTDESAKLKTGVTYKTSNKKVFTVSKSGQITAVGKGSATLTISHGAISASYKVTVK